MKFLFAYHSSLTDSGPFQWSQKWELDLPKMNLTQRELICCIKKSSSLVSLANVAKLCSHCPGRWTASQPQYQSLRNTAHNCFQAHFELLAAIFRPDNPVNLTPTMQCTHPEHISSFVCKDAKELC